MRVDKNGDTLWTRSYDGGSNLFDRAWWIKTIPGTNDFFLTGPKTIHPDENSDIWIMRIDSVGNIKGQSVWQDTLRLGPSDVRWGCLTPEGGCLVVGATRLRDTTYIEGTDTITHRNSTAVIIKTDSLCNILWFKEYNRGNSDHYTRSVTACVDGGYLVSTYDKYPGWTWILRIDEMGDTLWTDYIGLDPWDPETRLANFTMVVNDAGSGYYFAGSGQGWAWIIRTDSNLNEYWRVPADFGSSSDQFLSCVLTPDGGVCASGQTYSVAPTAYSDIFVMRLDRWGGDYAGVAESAQKPNNIHINAYPNPFNSSVRINVDIGSISPPGACRVDIFDLSGRLVESLDLMNNSNTKGANDDRSISWQPSPSVPTGVYLVKMEIDHRTVSKRLIYLK